MPGNPNIHTLSDILVDVRTVLDQNQAETGILSSNRDTLELDALIEQKALHAARQIFEVAPLWMFHEGGWGSSYVQKAYSQVDSLQNPGHTEPQTISRPSDFLRVLSAHVQGAAQTSSTNGELITGLSWHKVLTNFLPTDSDEYLLTSSNYEGVRPNEKRPLLFYNNSSGEFEFYGCKFGKATLKYLILPAYITDETVEGKFLPFPDLLYEALLYQTASLVETAYKNLPAAQMYSSIARSYMGLGENDTQTQTTKQK